MSDNTLAPALEQSQLESNPLLSDKHEMAKLRIKTYSETLINQSELTEKITKKITDFNNFLKPVSDKITKINTQDNLIKMVNLFYFGKNIDSINGKLSVFTYELNLLKDDTKSCIESYEDIIIKIKDAQKDLNGESKFYEHSAGIVTFNEIRIQDMKNKILNINNILETIENFKTSTIYHLKESIGQELSGKNAKDIIDENLKVLTDKILITQKSYSALKYTYSALFVLAAYNFWAYKFPIKYTSKEEIYKTVESGSFEAIGANAGVLTNSISEVMANIVKTGGVIAGGGLVLMGVFSLMSATRPESDRSAGSGLMMIVFGSVISILPSIMLDGILDDGTEQVFQGVKHTNVTLEFYNLGLSGCFVLIFAAIAFVILSLVKKAKLKRLTNNKIDVDATIMACDRNHQTS